MHNDTNNLGSDAELIETDPRLDALLDEALTPESVPGGVPPQLAARVFEATHARLRGRRHGILASIGPVRWGAAIAATVLLAFGAALYFRTGDVATPPIVVGNGQALAEVERDLKALSNYNGPAGAIDEDLLALHAQVDLAQTGWETPRLVDNSTEDLDSFPEATDASMVF